MRRLLRRKVKAVLRRLGYEVRVTRMRALPQRGAFSPSFRPYVVKAPLSPPDAPRVLHIVGNFYTGGSARLVVDLVERLGDRYAQTVLTRDAPSPPAYVVPNLRTEPWLDSPDEALRVISESHPDLVHVHYLGPAFSGIEVGDWQWLTKVFRALEQWGGAVIENVNIPIAPYVSDVVDRYVFVSDYVRMKFGYPGSRSLTIHPGSDVDRFTRGEHVPLAEGCVGMVYRLQGDKLNARAIDVFVEVVRRRPGTRALIVGGGPLLASYKQTVAAAGLSDRFTFTGYVAYEELPAYFEQMSVFVAPVHAESFGHVVPLAMSMELPVAAFDVGALSEILGDPAVLAPAGDVSSLADRVHDLLEDRSRMVELGTANRERAVERFSVETMVARYSQLYDELLSHSSAASSGRAEASGLA